MRFSLSPLVGRPSGRGFGLVLGFVGLGCMAAAAQSGSPAPMEPMKTHDPRLAQVTEAMQRVKAPSSAAISPDGSTVAWVLGGRGGGELHLTGLAPAGASQDASWERVLSPDTYKDVTNRKAGICGAGSPIWSPDGKRLAFISACVQKDGAWVRGQQDQIFVWTLAGNELKAVTRVAGLIEEAAWSPDGTKMGFLFVENATRSAGALAAMKPWSGVIGEDGVEIQRIAVADVATGDVKQVTPATLHVYEWDWSPDSKKLSFVAAVPPGENTWWVAQLYVQQIGSEPKSILDPTRIAGPLHGLQLAVPRWSPDGTKIGFIGGLMSDQGSTGGDIYVVAASGGEPKDVTPGRTATPVWFKWESNTSIGINEDVRGKNHLFVYDLATGKESAKESVTLEQSVRSGGIKGAISGSKGGSIALIRSSFNEPPEVWAGPLDGLKQLTHLNDGAKPVWGKGESIEWTNDGYNVQGWLMYPADYDPAKKYPMIVSVHGGPSASVGSTWGGGGALFSAMGYFVFSPNPRGSYGQGETFTQANRKDFGYGDLRDILAGMDVIEKKFPIDKNREGLTGWSYGGFMTMFGVTKTTRFKAAVAGAGISNWLSYYGENSIDQWMVPFFGASVYEDPAVYAKSSAINFIKQVKTPTLVIVGDRDGECPPPQSFEFWHALRAVGVKTQLVVYPNEGHGFRDPEHIRDRNERMLQWFAAEMP